MAAGTTPYLETNPAYGFEITFTGGGTIDPGSITIGNTAACAGSSLGGSTFCNTGASTTVPWKAFLVGTDTLEFLAQSASYDQTTGLDYFVNVFFDGATPTGFTGTWLTEFTPTPTVPLPAALPLFATGLGVLGLLGWRRKRKDAAIAAA